MTWCGFLWAQVEADLQADIEERRGCPPAPLPPSCRPSPLPLVSSARILNLPAFERSFARDANAGLDAAPAGYSDPAGTSPPAPPPSPASPAARPAR